MNAPPPLAPEPLLRIEGLVTRFHGDGQAVTAVDSIDLEVKPGEIFGLVGESGCGKSATCRSVIRLFGGAQAEIASGRILFEGSDLARLDERALEDLRGSRIAMIFQDPMAALNPTMRIGEQIAEGLLRHRRLGRAQARKAAIGLLTSVGVTSPAERLHSYPHQFSGGMRQRVLIAIALACRPRLLIADEPTTALDVTIQDQILKLILRLRRETGMGVLLVTHDLGVVAQTCDRVAVMYAGKIVESGETAQLFRRPAHPYTMALLDALPAHTARGAKLRPIGGEPPNLACPPAGCRFHPRCGHAIEICRQRLPRLEAAEPGHLAACLRLGELGNPVP
jgi:oligopeptide/dipeptide ABC transporter ATP-binding protein